MRNKFWIYSWRGGYQQAADLADGLPGLIIRREGSRYRYQPGDVIINWGSSVRPPMMDGHPILNAPEKVGKGKIYQWSMFEGTGIPTVEWTDNPDLARHWLEKYKIVARDFLHAMGGMGITVYKPGDQLGNHPVYTKYFRKQREFRFHVMNDRVFFVQEKKRKKDYAGNIDRYIRSHGRGWCFAFEHLGDRGPCWLG